MKVSFNKECKKRKRTKEKERNSRNGSNNIKDRGLFKPRNKNNIG